jgi:hypothetical protein
MFTSQNLRPRYFVLLVLLVIVGASMYAFAAANTVEQSGAGIGSEVISGYAVTNVAYTLAADPTYLESVAFSTAPITGTSVATEAQVQLVPSGTWFVCAGVAGAFTCAITPTLTADATTLNVVAVQ